MDLGEIKDICELQAAYFRGENYLIGIKYPWQSQNGSDIYA